MILTRDLKEFLELLNANRVEYLIVGGYALSQFGFDSLGLTSKDFLAIEQVVQLGIPPNRIDLLTSISGVGFDEAWKLRAAGTLDDIPGARV
jgi:hypothetical protein